MRLALLIALVFFLSLGDVPDARAQEVQATAPHRDAIGLGHQGLRKFTAGDFVGAREDFEAAERLAHSPVFLLYQARSELHLGRFRRAKELLRSCAAESIAPTAPETWRKALVEAAQELQAVTDAMPSLRFVIVGTAEFPVEVQLGGDSFSLSDAETTREFDPGAFDLFARDANGTTIRMNVFLKQGQKEQKTVLSFPRISPALAASDSVGSTRVAPAPPPRVPPRAYRSGAHAAFLLGGSAFLFSAVATTIAVTKARAVKRHCTGQSCRPQDQAVAENAIQWAHLATAGVVAGTAGVATGVGLLFYPAPGSVEISYRARF